MLLDLAFILCWKQEKKKKSTYIAAAINNANARNQDFIVLLQQFIGLNQNHTILKNNVIQLERNISTMAISRNQSFIVLSEKVAGLVQNNTVLKDNVIQLERNFTVICNAFSKWLVSLRMSKSHCLFCMVCKLRSNSITFSFNIVLFCTRFATCVCNKALSRFRWIISSSSDVVSFGSERQS
jgi:hypothetical protein